MSRYNKDGPLTEKQLARIKQQIAGAHALGGPAYADCKEILGRPLSRGRKPGITNKPKPASKPSKAWWGGLP